MLEYIFTSWLLVAWIIVAATILTLGRWLSEKYHWAFGFIGLIAGLMAYLCCDYFAQSAMLRMSDNITKGVINVFPVLLGAIFFIGSFSPNKLKVGDKENK